MELEKQQIPIQRDEETVVEDRAANFTVWMHTTMLDEPDDRVESNVLRGID